MSQLLINDQWLWSRGGGSLPRLIEFWEGLRVGVLKADKWLVHRMQARWKSLKAPSLSLMFAKQHERAHPDANCEEWTFSWWDEDQSIAGYTSYRLLGQSDAWYCWGLWRPDAPLLHITEFEIPRRSDPMIAKASALWAEYTCDSPFEQWSLGNETYAVELEDPQDALGLAYGNAVPIASDLEWYADGEIEFIVDGYQQSGVLLGAIETVGGTIEISEIRAARTHRWTAEATLPQAVSGKVVAHLGPRLPFKFPTGDVLDLVLTVDGWVTQ